MTKDNNQHKIDEYSERHLFWRDKILTQLGYSINLFLTIGFGLVAFLMSQKDKFLSIKIDFSLAIDWGSTFYYSTVFLVTISILLGAISVTSRLFDLRITGHITFVRKRSLQKYNTLLPDNLSQNLKITLLGNYFYLMFKILHKINKADYENMEILKPKFQLMRVRTEKLGELVWLSHRLQILAIVLAVISYGLIFLS